MAASLRPQLQNALLRRLSQRGASHKKNIFQKGFTLVELMIVIVIVGILSAVALPQFLGVKDKAQINTQLGEAAGLAKECAAAIISESPYPVNYTALTTVTGLTISGNCNGGNTSTPPSADITYTTEAAAADGAKCGTTAMVEGNQCVITVSKDSGQITYSIGAAAEEAAQG